MDNDVIDYTADHTNDGAQEKPLNLFASLNEHQRKNMVRWWAQSAPVDSFWFHRSGRPYQVVGHTNMDSDNWDTYPPTIVYKDYDGHTWSRPAHDWHRSMTRNTVDNWKRLK